MPAQDPFSEAVLQPGSVQLEIVGFRLRWSFTEGILVRAVIQWHLRSFHLFLLTQAWVRVLVAGGEGCSPELFCLHLHTARHVYEELRVPLAEVAIVED